MLLIYCKDEGYSKHQVFDYIETELYLIVLPGHILALLQNRLDKTKNVTSNITQFFLFLERVLLLLKLFMMYIFSTT